MNLMMNNDILFEVVTYLPYDSILQLQRVCTMWKNVLRSERLWKFLLERDFPKCDVEKPYDLNYYIRQSKRLIPDTTVTIFVRASGNISKKLIHSLNKEIPPCFAFRILFLEDITFPGNGKCRT